MAKLKDIFPKWLFKERGYGDLEIGGGSAFAHLTEDAENTRLAADWQLYVSNDPSAYSILDPGGELYAFSDGKSIDITPAGSNALALQTDGASIHFAIEYDDGSLHWGDGTAAPDVGLSRTTAGYLVVSADGSADGANVQIGGSDGFVYAVSPNAGLTAFEVDVLGEARERFTIKSDGSLHFGDGTAAPDVSQQRNAFGQLVFLDGSSGVYVAASDPTMGSGAYVGFDGDGNVYLANSAQQQVQLEVDADGDLTVNGTKVALQA